MTRRQGILIVATGLAASALGSGFDTPKPHVNRAATVRSRTQAIRPLAFEANGGQLDAQARFVARTPSYSLFFTEREAVLSGGNDVVRLRFDRSNTQTRLVPVEPLAHKTNYLLGNDPKRWKTGISSYAKLRYEELYPGIDLIFYGSERELEYDLVVNPGSDPSVVRMTLDGAGGLRIDDHGDLVGRTTSGEMRLRKPVIYQRAATGVLSSINGHYRLDDAQTIAFEVDKYDRSQPLVIDPVVVYSTYLGGSGSDVTAGSSGGGGRRTIAVDATGAAYITGTTNSLDFPTTAGSFQPAGPNALSAFVTKIAPDGESLVYSTYINGTKGNTVVWDGVLYSTGEGIAVDASGHAYVVGNVSAADFPANEMPFAGGRFRNMFLLKLDPSGSSLAYSILFGNGLDEAATGVAIDAGGNAYVTGATNGSLSNTGLVPPDALQSVCRCSPNIGGVNDAFVVKFNATATAVIYGTYLGGSGGDVGSAIAVSAAGEAYVTGRTTSEDFPSVNAAQPTRPGGRDDFVAKLNASGSAFVFSTYLGGTDSESANALGSAVAVDPVGNAYVTGYTSSGDFPRTPGAFQVDPGPGPAGRAYAVKYTSGGQLIYSTFLAGNGGSFGTSVAADSSGRAYLTGNTGSSNFPVTPDATQPALAGGPGGSDAYITVLDPTGSALVFSTFLGGTSTGEYASGIALGPGGSIYVAGVTEGNGSFPTTANALQAFRASVVDLFISRIDIQPPDTTPPVISAISVAPALLWPPNHSMRQVTVSLSASDAVSSATCAITNVSSNEPQLGTGSGDVAPDWQNTTGLTTWLRAERGGGRGGRVYTLTVSCTDEAGNTASQNVGVSVPLNQGK